MRFLKTSEAAHLLNVSPNTLRAWERRFDFPKPQRSPGRHRLYTHGEVAALRDALQEGLSISSAISRAREGLSGDANSLAGALISFERERADGAMEATLALRSVERSVEEVLLPTLEEIVRRHSADSAQWAFAAAWGTDWLRRATRMAPSPVRPASLLIADASRDDLDSDAPYIRALELLCLRGGIRVLTLSARGTSGVSDAIAVHRPSMIVIAGNHLSDDAVARWAYGARVAARAVPLAVFRRGDPRQRVRTTSATPLPVAPSAARKRLLELTEEQGRAAIASRTAQAIPQARAS